MPPAAHDLEIVSRHAALWRTFDPAVKTELFATAINSDEATWLIDPGPLAASALDELRNQRPPVCGIVVTNQNHWRASGALAEQFSVPIFAHADAKADDAPPFTPLIGGERPGGFLDVVTVAGAAPGEIAIVAHVGPTLLVLGDALINFDPYGFTFLPRKYCTNYARMLQSLTQLREIEAGQIFFAHGLPILSNSRNRLKALLDEI